MAIQLDLFRELSEVDILRKELEEIRSRNENVRKGIFARHNELAKLFIELSEKVEKLTK
jgi:hypothetical protein